jgi:hypothetical protein
MKLSPTSPLFPIFTDYEVWLSKQPLSAHTQRAYRTQVRQFVTVHSPKRSTGTINEMGIKW